MEEKVYEISLGQIFRLVIKRWYIIICAAIVGAGLAFAYTHYFVTPTYTARAKLGVTGNVSAYQDIVLGQTFAKDGEDIITSNITLNRVVEKLNDPTREGYTGKVYTVDSVHGMISTVTSDESRYFDLIVRSTDRQEAKDVADMVVAAFKEVLEQGIAIEGGKGFVIHTPTLPTSPSSPNVPANVAVGALLGLLISAGCVIVLGFVNNALDSEDWLIETYRDKIPLLATIPDSDIAGSGYKKYGYKKHGYHSYKN